MSKEAALLNVAQDTDGGEGGPMLFPEFVEVLVRLCLARYGPLPPERNTANTYNNNAKRNTGRSRGEVLRGMGNSLLGGGGGGTASFKVWVLLDVP